MKDACEAPRCPRCDGPMAEPIERNPRSLATFVRICANCQVAELVAAVGL